MTFLAFGNGAPDIMSSIIALHSIRGDAGLAIGELIGIASGVPGFLNLWVIIMVDVCRRWHIRYNSWCSCGSDTESIPSDASTISPRHYVLHDLMRVDSRDSYPRENFLLGNNLLSGYIRSVRDYCCSRKNYPQVDP